MASRKKKLSSALLLKFLNYVTLSPSVTEKYYAQVKGASISVDSSHVFPCNAAPPHFAFGAANSKFTVPGGQLIFGALADNVTYYGAIQSSGDETIGYFGTPFLEGIFTVFDYGAERLGFASATSPNY
jgi:hypothetical protein